MEELKVKSITLDSDGVLKVKTNISDNLELAKYVSKDKMEKVLNQHPLEMHIYQNEYAINSIHWQGELVSFTYQEFKEFMIMKHKQNVS
tara:strand:+ start:600 stop:866 length:267 start_codon:yes stop_codon:yes gene_type:complete